MNIVRIVSSFGFYVFRILAIAYLVTGLYAGFALMMGSPLAAPVQSDSRFEIYYPFSQVPFLLGENSTAFVVEMLLGISLYGVFFWLLSNVFSTFRQPKLFTQQGIAHLTWFYRLNFLVPLAVLLLLSVVSSVEQIMVMLVVLHGLLGVFALFMAAIFKQGVHLQNEQDLYI